VRSFVWLQVAAGKWQVVVISIRQHCLMVTMMTIMTTDVESKSRAES